MAEIVENINPPVDDVKTVVFATEVDAEAGKSDIVEAADVSAVYALLVAEKLADSELGPALV